ncbi:hypothetical protein CDD83_8755 [Cordyceps sp. RAO-2017]|nr:hypothetical protein CDD83_8755 [Cordyceps sp. RAO-2017]
MAPEATVPEILADAEDAWAWVRTGLAPFVRARTGGAVAVDPARVLVAGESAGGTLSLMLGLSHPGEIRAVTAAFPGVDWRSPHFSSGDYEKPPMMGRPQLDRSVIDEHAARVAGGDAPAVVSDDPAFARLPLMFAAVQHGLFHDLFPPARRDLFILDRLDDGAVFPRGGVFVWHGAQDTIVPVEGSLKLRDKIAERDPDLSFRLTIRDGDHGFDDAVKIDEPWMAAGLVSVVSAWLS